MPERSRFITVAIETIHEEYQLKIGFLARFPYTINETNDFTRQK